MTQPNPLKTKMSDPLPTQPNPTQPAGLFNAPTTMSHRHLSLFKTCTIAVRSTTTYRHTGRIPEVENVFCFWIADCVCQKFKKIITPWISKLEGAKFGEFYFKDSVNWRCFRQSARTFCGRWLWWWASVRQTAAKWPKWSEPKRSSTSSSPTHNSRSLSPTARLWRVTWHETARGTGAAMTSYSRPTDLTTPFWPTASSRFDFRSCLFL